MEINNDITKTLEIEGDDEKYFVRPFFRKIIEAFAEKKSNSQYIFITVNHVVPTLLFFLEAIEKIGDAKIGAIIPKSSVNDVHVKELVERYYKDAFAYQSDIKFNKYNKYFVKNDIKKLLSENPIFSKELIEYVYEQHKKPELELKIVVVDIGGYFAPCLELLSDTDSEIISNNFVGIVEDTENGQQKYIHAIQRSNLEKFKPVVSVARSPIKESEDVNVGLSIVRATDSILRIDAHTILERISPIGIIGFGKIGRAIVHSLQDMGIHDITVCEVDPNRAREAANRPYSVKVILREDTKIIQENFKKFLNENRLIFCATGSKSLRGEDFLHLNENVFISSCTSADDEFDFKWLVKNSIEYRSTRTGNVTAFTLKNGKKLNFLVRGNAVNFAFGAVNGPGIYGVLAGLIAASLKLIEKKFNSMSKRIIISEKYYYELSRADMERLSHIWLEHFNPMKSIDSYVQYRRRQQTWGFHTDSEKIFCHTKTKDRIVKIIKDFFDENITSIKLPAKEIVLEGNNGSGKSSVAKEVARDQAFWVRPRYFFHADSLASLEIDYRKLAEKLNLASNVLATNKVMKIVKNYLEDTPGWVIIYDNINNWNEIKAYVPQTGGIILCTCNQITKQSNISSIQIEQTRIELLPLELDESLGLIRSICDLTNLDEIKKLNTLEAYFGMPLILMLIGNYLKFCKNITKFIIEFKKLDNGKSETIDIIVKMLIELMNNDSKIGNTLSTLVYFSNIFPDHNSINDLKDYFDYEKLADYGLIKIEGKFIHIHRNVQKAIRAYLNESIKQQMYKDALKYIISWYSNSLKKNQAETSIDSSKSRKLALLTIRNLSLFFQHALNVSENDTFLRKEIIEFLLLHEDYFKWSYNWDHFLSLTNHKLLSIDDEANEPYISLVLLHLAACTIYFYQEKYYEMLNYVNIVDIYMKKIKFNDANFIIRLASSIIYYLKSACYRGMKDSKNAQENIDMACKDIMELFEHIPEILLEAKILNIDKIVNKSFIYNVKAKIFYNYCAFLNDLRDQITNLNEINALKKSAIYASKAEKLFEQSNHYRYQYRTKLRLAKVHISLFEKHLLELFKVNKQNIRPLEIKKIFTNDESYKSFKFAKDFFLTSNSQFIKQSIDIREVMNFYFVFARFKYIHAVKSLLINGRHYVTHCKQALNHIDMSINIAESINLQKTSNNMSYLKKLTLFRESIIELMDYFFDNQQVLYEEKIVEVQKLALRSLIPHSSLKRSLEESDDELSTESQTNKSQKLKKQKISITLDTYSIFETALKDELSNNNNQNAIVDNEDNKIKPAIN